MRSAATAILLFLGIVAVAQSDGDSSGNPAPNPVKLDVQTYTLYKYTHPNVKPNEFPSVKIGTTVISQSSRKLNMSVCDNSSSLEPYWVYNSTDQKLTLVSRNRSDFDYGNLHIDGKVVNTTDRLGKFPECSPQENAGLGPTHPYQPEWIALSISVAAVLGTILVALCGSIGVYCAVTRLRRRLGLIRDYCRGWKKPQNVMAAKQDTDKPGENPRRRNAQNTAARGSSSDGGRDEYAGQALVELHGDRPISDNPRFSPELTPLQVEEEPQPSKISVDATNKPDPFSSTHSGLGVVLDDSRALAKLEHIHGDGSSSDNPVSPPISMETSPPVVKETQLTMTCVQPTSKPGHSSQSHTFTSSYSDN